MALPSTDLRRRPPSGCIVNSDPEVCMTRLIRSTRDGELRAALVAYGLLLSSLIFIVSIVAIAALITGLPSR